MDLRQLRTFVTVAEQGTVSEAAVRLRTAQPALSRQIGELESGLGLKLFDRVRRRLVLTSEGEQLLGDCRTVLGAAATLGEHARVLRHGDGGVIRVAATPQTIEGIFSPFLARYTARHPDVEVRLIESVGGHLLRMVEHGDVHVAIALQAQTADNDALEAMPLAPLEFLAASHRRLPLGNGGDLEIAKLAPHPLLLLDGSFQVRKTFDAACRLAKLKPRIFLESRAPHALLALAEAGHGVAIIPSVLPTARYRLRIARLTHRRKPLGESLAILRDKRRALPAYVRDFCEALAAHVREVFPVSKPR